MIILHYIQSMALSSGIIPEYVNSLVRSTDQVATSYIVTEKDFGTSPITFHKGFKHQLKLYNPDIVHIHGAWNAHTAWVEYISRKNGYFTVVSPHGELSPAKMEQKFWTERFPRILIYQLRMIKKCNMLVVTTREELEDMKNMKWKKNMVLIPHPVVNDLSAQEVSSLLLSSYRKVIDTHYRVRLTAEDEEFFYTCLRAGIWQENEELPSDMAEPNKMGVSFRRLYLFAHDENVTDIFIKGARRLQVDIPPIPDIDAIPRFKVKKEIDKKALKRYKSTMHLLQELSHAKVNDLEAIQEVNLLALLNLFSLIRFNDYDEDLVAQQFKKRGLRKYLLQSQKTLTELFHLEEGYWIV